MKTEQEIRDLLDQILEQGANAYFHDEYMRGYVAALRWALKEITGKNNLPKQ